ncbi:hypothetical protein [Algoriphagus antarcticus]|uniref:hypothetical protein n=1 Tax=Algoriphagus antarcticus TaxID=238540 RepID=UPI0037420981
MAVFGEKLNFEKLLGISIELDKIDLLQTIDLVHFEKIKEAELKKNISSELGSKSMIWNWQQKDELLLDEIG